MKIQTITVDGVEHQISEFSEQVQKLAAIYETWSQDLEKEKLAAAKTETALNVINKELATLVQAEMAAKQEPAPAE